MYVLQGIVNENSLFVVALLKFETYFPRNPLLTIHSVTICFFICFFRAVWNIAKFLLSKGVSVDGESSLLTPLLIATFRGYPSIVKILLEHGADVCANCNSYFYLLWKLHGSLLSPIVPTCFSVSLSCWCVTLIKDMGNWAPRHKQLWGPENQIGH